MIPTLSPGSPPRTFAGKTALVTGASRGLGLALARGLARQGARLVVCGRDPDSLARAASELRGLGAQVREVSCDLTAEGAAKRLVVEAVNLGGGVDLLINNAGVIQVGPVSAMAEADYRSAMETMYFAPLRLILAALPTMRGRERPTIVNVTSIGGRIAAPHLLPYDGAKFAFTGLSEGLRAELARQGVAVTTVVPGLMRTGSHLAAEFRGSAPREYAWFAAAAALPLLSIDADRAARMVLDAAARRRPEVVLGAVARAVTRLHSLAPATSVRVLTLAARALDSMTVAPPEGDGATAETAVRHPAAPVPGYEAAPALDSQVHRVLTTLGGRAANRFNQPGATRAD